MTAPDRLFDELLRPIVDDYYGAAKALTASSEASTTARVTLVARMNAFKECGDLVARVHQLEQPYWDGLRVQAALPW